MTTSQIHQIDHPSPATPLPPPILTLASNLTIRPYHPSDAPSIAKHKNNLAIWNNLRNRAPYPYLESDAANWIAVATNPSTFIASGPYTPDQTQTASQRDEIVASGPKLPTHYTITVPATDSSAAEESIGAIGLDFGAPGEIYARTAELGYWLAESHWGRGVMGRVVPAFVEWSWRTFGVLVRINAEVREGNVASWRVLERAGFRVEGRRERAMVKGGVEGNVVFLGMVREVVEEEG